MEDVSSEAETLQRVKLFPVLVRFLHRSLSDFSSPPPSPYQNVGSFCSAQLLAAGAQLSGQQEEVKRTLEEVQDQTLDHTEELERQRSELQQQLESSRQLVCSFLQEDLQQDIPTGTWTTESPPTHTLSGTMTRSLSHLQGPRRSAGTLSIPASWRRCRAAASCWRL